MKRSLFWLMFLKVQVQDSVALLVWASREDNTLWHAHIADQVVTFLDRKRETKRREKGERERENTEKP
jgi:hypothetical protein